MNNNMLKIGIALFVTVIVLAGLRWTLRRRRNKIHPAYFKRKWLELQRYCANRETWSLAVTSADKLLEEALMKRGMKGKSLGERLASAQHSLTNNDSVWYAHNLAKKLAENPTLQLREADVKKALIGVRQALRDLEVLHGK